MGLHKACTKLCGKLALKGLDFLQDIPLEHNFVCQKYAEGPQQPLQDLFWCTTWASERYSSAGSSMFWRTAVGRLGESLDMMTCGGSGVVQVPVWRGHGKFPKRSGGSFIAPARGSTGSATEEAHMWACVVQRMPWGFPDLVVPGVLFCEACACVLSGRGWWCCRSAAAGPQW